MYVPPQHDIMNSPRQWPVTSHAQSAGRSQRGPRSPTDVVGGGLSGATVDGGGTSRGGSPLAELGLGRSRRSRGGPPGAVARGRARGRPRRPAAHRRKNRDGGATARRARGPARAAPAAEEERGNSYFLESRHGRRLRPPSIALTSTPTAVCASAVVLLALIVLPPVEP